MQGVRGFVSASDVPGSNKVVYDDELVFADGVVTSEGQIIGVVVAENKKLAQRGVRAVKISYHDLPSVCTIEVGQKIVFSVIAIAAIHMK